MSSILVNTAVFHLKDEERKAALSMMLLLGLRHYTEKTGTQTIDLPKLQHLHGMWPCAFIFDARTMKLLAHSDYDPNYDSTSPLLHIP